MSQNESTRILRVVCLAGRCFETAHTAPNRPSTRESCLCSTCRMADFTSLIGGEAAHAGVSGRDWKGQGSKHAYSIS